MSNSKIFAFILLFLFYGSSSASDPKDYKQHAAASPIENIRTNKKALYKFFKAMPKGGELHYHFDGGVSAKNILNIIALDNYCMDTQTFILSNKCKNQPNLVPISSVLKNKSLYQQTVCAWSMRDCATTKESQREHFFSSFQKFGIMVHDHQSQLLSDIIKKAASQNELYMEIQLFELEQADKYAKLIHHAHTFDEKQKILLKNPSFIRAINQTAARSQELINATRHQLGCDRKHKPAACDVTVKFQYFIKRDQPLDNIFAQALAGFATTKIAKDIVGVNLVRREDNMVALRDYKQQMFIIKYLHKKYPQVHISLHAGELSLTNLKKSENISHIQDAIFIGHAERIGHGVAITHEPNKKSLIEQMAKKSVAVEINLTSNHLLLNISGNQHPLQFYLHNNIPVILSTDDEGIFNTNLTKQYVNAVYNYHLDYQTIKKINRNTLTYSFLPGRSLWLDPVAFTRIHKCQQLNSLSCKQFIKHNEKAQLQWLLEQRLHQFENQNKISFLK